MKVLQSQLTNYCYHSFEQKEIKLVRWWILQTLDKGIEMPVPFNREEESMFVKFMEDHPYNFPKNKIERFNSENLILPELSLKEREGDGEKPCILLIRKELTEQPIEIFRRMDIELQNADKKELPFEVIGEIILEESLMCIIVKYNAANPNRYKHHRSFYPHHFSFKSVISIFSSGARAGAVNKFPSTENLEP